MQVKTKFNAEVIKKDFPILQQQAHGKPLVYLDNGASTQKPKAVIDAINYYYSHDNANVHRGVYSLSERATAAYEGARAKIKNFIHAEREQEIIFVRGTTEAINLVAQTYGRKNINSGDEILISAMEHHANIVPWQMLCEEKGAKLVIIPLNVHGEIDIAAYKKLLNKNTKLLAVSHVSNVLGTINPIKQMIEIAHTYAVPVLVDGAQAMPHMPVNVQELGCDFYAFSAHKMYGPTGVGVLYGKAHLLNAMPPYQGGGDMIKKVSFVKSEYNDLPYKFEAGTPDIAGVVGLGAAIDYLNAFGMENIAEYEQHLLKIATLALENISNLRLIGTAQHKAAVISFVVDGIHPHDLATVLDYEGVAIRAGHHCAMPLMELFHIPATARASFGIYNTENDVEVLVAALNKAKKIFQV